MRLIGVSHELPLADEERRLLRRKAKRIWRGRRAARMTRSGASLACLIGAVVIVFFVSNAVWEMLLSFVVLSTAVGLLVWYIDRSGRAVVERELVREQGLDVCLGCGYWLRGAERCSECGRSAVVAR